MANRSWYSERLVWFVRKWLFVALYVNRLAEEDYLSMAEVEELVDTKREYRCDLVNVLLLDVETAIKMSSGQLSVWGTSDDLPATGTQHVAGVQKARDIMRELDDAGIDIYQEIMMCTLEQLDTDYISSDCLDFCDTKSEALLL